MAQMMGVFQPLTEKLGPAERGSTGTSTAGIAEVGREACTSTLLDLKANR